MFKIKNFDDFIDLINRFFFSRLPEQWNKIFFILLKFKNKFKSIQPIKNINLLIIIKKGEGLLYTPFFVFIFYIKYLSYNKLLSLR